MRQSTPSPSSPVGRENENRLAAGAAPNPHGQASAPATSALEAMRELERLSPFDRRVRLLLVIGGEARAEVSSGSIMKGHIEEAIFENLLPGFVECVGKSFGRPPTPQPTGTEVALAEAKRHIGILTRFYIDNPAWVRAAEDARAFISGTPQASNAEAKQNPHSGATP